MIDEAIFDDPDNISRRNFLNKSVNGIKAIALGSFTVALINACSNDSNPVSPSGNSNAKITVDITDSSNQALQNIGGIVALSGNDLDNSGIFVVRKTDSAVDAFSRYCTHQGCTVSPFHGTVATCSCHGSEFNTSGGVVRGPASRSLHKYTAVLEGNIITITS